MKLNLSSESLVNSRPAKRIECMSIAYIKALLKVIFSNIHVYFWSMGINCFGQVIQINQTETRTNCGVGTIYWFIIAMPWQAVVATAIVVQQAGIKFAASQLLNLILDRLMSEIANNQYGRRQERLPWEFVFQQIWCRVKGNDLQKTTHDWFVEWLMDSLDFV